MAEKQVVLKKINMSQNMIEYHDIEPVRIIVVIKRNSRSGIDDGFIGISGIQLVLTLFL